MNTFEHKASSVAETPLVGHDRPQVDTNSPEPKLGRWAWVVLAVLIVGLVFGAVPRWMHRRDLATVTHELAILSVQVLHAAPGKATASLVLPAELRPFEEAPIYARASGYITNWFLDIGASVKTGQLLAKIDAPELEQQLDGARAELVQAEAAEALAGVTANRWAELTKTSSVSEQENAEKQADLKLKIATVDAAKANVRRLEELESFTQVTAPFAGTLTARAIDVGDLITPGKELFRLADTTKLRVFVRVPQSAAPGIVTGLNAQIALPERPAQKYEAKVMRTAGAIDPNSRTMLTELGVDNSKNELLAGSFAQIEFADLKQDPSLVLPSTTLLFRDGVQVGVVGADNKVTLHDITIGRDFGKTVEVLSGITDDDRIINNPIDSLTAGTTVRVVETETADKTK